MPVKYSMSYVITCYTLFDVKQTNVLNRNRPSKTDDEWLYKRNTQANLDTIIQTISLRSQPELVAPPVYNKTRFEHTEFGFLYKKLSKSLIKVWTFDFVVQHPSVFNDEYDKLGKLYNDCDGVPMIKCGTEFDKLSNFLDTTPELRNIYFVSHE
jgi:hypothetical protein